MYLLCFSSNKNIIIIILGVSYFYITKDNSIETFENLITNGNFSSGNKTGSVKVMNNNNKIVNMPNPGDNNYVLKQSSQLSKNSNETDVFYVIEKKLEQKNNYMFSAWVTETKNWDGKDTLFYVKIWMNSGPPKILISSGDIVSTKTVKDYQWELRQFSVLMPADSTGHIQWYLGYNPDNLEGYRYITNVSLDVYYPQLKELKAIDNLRAMVSSFDDNSFDSNSNTKIWKDMTNHKNDFVWSNIPIWNKTAGFNTANNILIGNSLSDIVNLSDEFTIVWYGQSLINTQGILFVIETIDPSKSLTYTIDGVKNTLNILQNNNPIASYSIGLPKMDIMYSVSYSKNGDLKLYINKVNMSTKSLVNVKNLQLKNTDFKFNPTGELSMKLYNLAVYNSALDVLEISNLYNYFIHISSEQSGSIKKIPLSYNYIKKPSTCKLQSLERVHFNQPNKNKKMPMENENYRWNELGNGQPKISTKITDDKGFTLENCKKACKYATRPICDGLSFDNKDGHCVTYSKMGNELVDIQNEDLKTLRFDFVQKDTVRQNTREGFVPTFMHPKKYNKETFFGTQGLNKTRKEFQKQNNIEREKVSKLLEEAEKMQSEINVVFNKKIKALHQSLTKNDRSQRDKLEKIIKSTNIQHKNESNQIEKKRLELLSELIKLENKVNDEPQPTISKNNIKSVENQGDLIDTQGSVVKNAKYCSSIENKADTAIFNRIVYSEEENTQSDWRDTPNMNQYIRKDKIPCWGCNLKEDNCYQKCKQKQEDNDDTDTNKIYKFLV